MCKVTITLLPVECLRTHLGEAARLLAATLYEKMMRYRREEDRLRSFASSLLLQKAAQGRSIYYNEEGKPLVEGLFFNLSHSGNYAVLAEADIPVGVDIEEMVSPGDWVREALTAQEYKWMLLGKDERDQQERFYRLWTRKESLVKCEGHGFSLSPGEISTMPVDEAQLIAYAGKTYGICSHNLHGYMLSAALHGKQPILMIRNLSWRDLAEDLKRQ
ncbi:4'-phosphopantetheinyl transferase superfamily protein [Anaerovibrio sp.]|uniref:4'-phosphopantetheinyl transferase family protein n=1 Tax=Anaerovibrio sp. TaxID=1872532 RepID=UPI0025C46425|nr:4'-phosphopantetheinyl transferase superfamily protein [Anaerovibrio sp.]MBR2143239.1 4'-phosphopantetheinyl transferase superfamily protein [Anaerovibrio sp.]